MKPNQRFTTETNYGGANSRIDLAEREAKASAPIAWANEDEKQFWENEYGTGLEDYVESEDWQ
jgi:hypothetical protein